MTAKEEKYDVIMMLGPLSHGQLEKVDRFFSQPGELRFFVLGLHGKEAICAHLWGGTGQLGAVAKVATPFPLTYSGMSY